MAKYLISRTVVIVLSGLTMGLTFAHVLELRQRLHYDAELWVALTRPNALYGYSASSGARLKSPRWSERSCWLPVSTPASGRLALAAALFHSAALAAWATIVAPANAAIGDWGRRGIPPDWEIWRTRWETGHAVALVLLAVGFGLLVLTSLREQRPYAGSPRDGGSVLSQDRF